MEQDVKKKPFNKRAFISFVMFLSGLCLPVSGLMNHRLQLEPLTGERHFWMVVHNIAAFLFVILAIIHISYNWRVLMNYIKNTKRGRISKEAIAAIALVIILVGLISSLAFHNR
jgi:hypothetical protein